MKHFVKEHPNQENVVEFYDKIDPSTYDNWNKYINFCDPYFIAQAISRPEPSEEQKDGAERDFGFLDMPRDSAIFDIGKERATLVSY